MKSRIGVILLLFALPAAAQEPFAARDVYEAVKMAGDYQRAIVPALDEAFDAGWTLQVLTKADNQLGYGPASESLDKALGTIDEFLARREKADKPLSKELMKFVQQERTAISNAKNGPPLGDLKPLHDQLHHEIIHRLQALVTTNIEQLHQLSEMLRRIADYAPQKAMSASVEGLRATAEEPK